MYIFVTKLLICRNSYKNSVTILLRFGMVVAFMRYNAMVTVVKGLGTTENVIRCIIVGIILLKFYTPLPPIKLT